MADLQARWAAHYLAGAGGTDEFAAQLIAEGHDRIAVEAARCRAIEHQLWGGKLPPCGFGIAPEAMAALRRGKRVAR